MDTVMVLIAMAAVFVFIFVFILITRELWCWYLKQNQMVTLLTEIRDELRKDKSGVKAIED